MTTFPQIDSEGTKVVQATIHTNKGAVKIELYPEFAPKTVENFTTHAKDNYYDGIIFHRIIKGFMIQGGDPTGTGMGGESIWGEAFEDEFTPALYNFRGALSMANSGPNTNGSQFFIVTADQVPGNMVDQMKSSGYPDEVTNAYVEWGGTPWLDQRHTVFGHVVDGMDIIETIENVKTGMGDKPVDDVIIENIEIIE